MGDKKEFVCLDGMKFVGDHKDTTCLDTGNWSHPLPSCLGPCTIPQVDHASSIHQLHPDVSLKQNLTNFPLRRVEVGTQVAHGSSLMIVCDRDYELNEHLDEEIGILQSPVCNNGTWSYTPNCNLARCKSKVPNLKNGRVRIVSNEHRAVGLVSCIDGYRLVGDNVTACERGSWTAINSSCQEIHCSFPGNIDHGRVLLVGLTGMYDYKPYIRRISNNRQIAYECENGYRLNDGAPSGATCINGQWKPEGLPLCAKE